MRRSAALLSLAFTAILPMFSSLAVAVGDLDEQDVAMDVVDVREAPMNPGTGKTAVILGTTNFVRHTSSGYEVETTAPGAYELSADSSDVTVWDMTLQTDLPLANDRADAAVTGTPDEVDTVKGIDEWVIVVGRLVILDEFNEPISEQLGTFVVDGDQVRVTDIE